jgi:methionine synthase I (cobalamin-dependent)
MMAPDSIMERFSQGRLLFDGAMGSMLIGHGLATGWPPEEWNASRPDVVAGVHRAYLAAGAEVLESNTFGATAGRLAAHGLADDAVALNAAAVRLTREAIAAHERRAPANRCRFVAFSMGPSGKMLPPVGSADQTQIRDEFLEQLRSVSTTVGPDLVLVETMLDLREALIALDVSKNTVDVPVAVSLTYNRNPRGFFTVMGDEASAATKQLEAAGADVIAANCSISSQDMLDLARLLKNSTSLPVLCQPNAGNPGVRDGMPVYEQTAQEFAKHALELLDLGVEAVGGCCGTTPEFIRHVSDALGPRRGGACA